VRNSDIRQRLCDAVASRRSIVFKESPEIILHSLSILLEKDAVAELRAPRSDRGPLAGLFDDLNEMAEVAAELNAEELPEIYVSLNPVNPSPRSRVKNRLATALSAVRDNDIDYRRWLPFDFDPIRPPNTSSNEAEHDAALVAAQDCRDWLSERGWPEALLADSGNGAHLLCRIEVPNDQPSCDLVKSCMEAVSIRFSNAEVQVDTGNSNASRVWRLYGTINRKGEHTTERPHRRAKLLETPKSIQIVSPALLNELASTLPPTSADNSTLGFDLSKRVTEYRVPVTSAARWNNGGYKWILQCPWNEAHRNKSAFIVQFPNGGIDAGCLHKSCADKNWPELRRIFEHQGFAGLSGDSNVIAGSQKETQVSQLLELVSDLRLFCTPQGETFAIAPVKNHRENYRLDSKDFKQYLRYKFFAATKTSVRPQTVQEAIAHF